ncbi:hypothetical protein NST72_15745 [Bacillus sp. FSL W7-1282]
MSYASVKGQTEELLHLLARPFPQEDDERDDFLEDVNRLLGLRHSMIEASTGSFTTEEASFLMEQDRLLTARLNVVSAAIKQDLKEIADQKRVHKGYERGDVLATKGAFIDEKTR